MYIDLFSEKNKPYEYNKELIDEVQNVKLEIGNARSQFNFATDSQEIESVIYRLKSLETRYSLLVRKAKLCKNVNIRAIEAEKI